MDFWKPGSSRAFELDSISVGVDRIQWNFGSMQKVVPQNVHLHLGPARERKPDLRLVLRRLGASQMTLNGSRKARVANVTDAEATLSPASP